MPSNRHLLSSSILLALASASALHGYVVGDPLMLADGRLSLDFNARVRVENRSNTFDFNSATDTINDDTFVLTRFRAGLKFTPAPRLSFYGQLQDAHELNSKRPNVPYVNAAEGDDILDLRQLYFDIGDPRDDLVYARLGRQMLAYGDERLIGGFEWNNFARTFDAAKVVWNLAELKTTVDAFAGNVVTIQGRNLGDENRYHFNNSDTHDLFAGIYAQTSAGIPNQRTDVYLLWRDKDRNGPFYRPNTLASGTTGVAPYDIPEQIATAGFRAQSISLARLNGFDYLVEAAIQWGRARPGLTNAVIAVPDWYDHNAYALHVELGYTLEKSPFLPRFSVEHNQASGDGNPTDHKSGGFLNLFHTNHKFYGYMDVLGWKNMTDNAATLRFKPLPGLSSSLKKSVLRLDYHWFALKTTQDLWYRANAITAVAAPAAAARGLLPKELGRELDATWSWSPSPPYELLLGYSHFWTGDYLPAARAVGGIPGAGSNASFAYAQVVLKL